MSSTHMVRVIVAAGGVLFASCLPAAAQERGCVTSADPASLAGRASPLDSLSFPVGGQTAQICYGRPSTRGRTMIGGAAVPFGTLWRTGANEPTMIHSPVALSIAGVEVGPGTYALYTVPRETEWEVIVNRSYAQWGRENRYTPEIAAQEVGRGKVPSQRADAHVEMFTIEHRDGNIILQWERTRVAIPIRPT
jgi:hypothetical protein